MEQIFDTVVEYHGRFEVEQFRIGRTNSEPSYLRLKVETPTTPSRCSRSSAQLLGLGCSLVDTGDAELRTVERDCCAPEDFYSTTNHRTYVRHDGQWIEVQNQRMDALIVVRGRRKPACRRLRDIRAGDQVVTGMRGIRVVPESKERDRLAFAFMSNGISSERQVETAVRQTAALIEQTRAAGQEDRCRGRTGGGSHRRRGAAGAADSRRLRAGAAERERAGRARYRSGAARHLARRPAERRPPGRARASQSHARHQRHLSLRRHSRRGGKRAACAAASCTNA